MQFIAKFDKSYKSTSEYTKRKNIFLAKKAFIDEQNSNPNKTMIAGLNKFSDWTD